MISHRLAKWALCAGAAFATVLAGVVAQACSTIVAASGSHIIVGRNADAPPIPGLLIVNHRGIAKRAMPWAVIGPGVKSLPTAQWVSRFGSVTVTALGRDFPDGGMNEKGLVVEEMSLDHTQYPSGRNRPTISQSQWIQYQLDEYDTVDQVAQHVDDFDITGWGWHFTVADASGSCATVEYIEGKPVITRSTHPGGCVLANDTLENSRAGMGRVEPGTEPQGLDSTARFTRATRALAGYAPDTDRGAENAFRLLSNINEGGKYTLRWFVHDISARRVYFRSAKQPTVKYVDLRRLDFSPTGPVKMLDVDTAGAGDMTRTFTNYTLEANEHVVTMFYSMITNSYKAAIPMLDADLQKAGLSQSEFIDLVAQYPGTTRAQVRSGSHSPSG
jgi:penicillin V acylase-like amidase (Ntn superfamily)